MFRQKRTKAQMIAYYKDVFGNRFSSKYVLADICRHGFIDQNTYVPGDPNGTAFNEGRRAMALHILNTLEMNPNEYVNQFHFSANSEQGVDIDAY